MRCNIIFIMILFLFVNGRVIELFWVGILYRLFFVNDFFICVVGILFLVVDILGFWILNCIVVFLWVCVDLLVFFFIMFVCFDLFIWNFCGFFVLFFDLEEFFVFFMLVCCVFLKVLDMLLFDLVFMWLDFLRCLFLILLILVKLVLEDVLFKELCDRMFFLIFIGCVICLFFRLRLVKLCNFRIKFGVFFRDKELEWDWFFFFLKFKLVFV